MYRIVLGPVVSPLLPSRCNLRSQIDCNDEHRHVSTREQHKLSNASISYFIKKSMFIWTGDCEWWKWRLIDRSLTLTAVTSIRLENSFNTNQRLESSSRWFENVKSVFRVYATWTVLDTCECKREFIWKISASKSRMYRKLFEIVPLESHRKISIQAV